VLGIEREAGVEGLHGGRAGPLAGEHVQEVGGVGQPGGGHHRVLALAHAVVRADGGGDLAGEPGRLAHVGGVRVVVGVRVEHSENGDGGLQGTVGIRVLRHEPERLDQFRGDRPGGGQGDHEGVELRRLGEFTVQEQVDDLLEGRLAGEVGDIVAAVGQSSMGAVQIAELGFGGDDALEPADQSTGLGHGGVLSESSCIPSPCPRQGQVGPSSARGQPGRRAIPGRSRVYRR
jgi:hypothetical protein